MQKLVAIVSSFGLLISLTSCNDVNFTREVRAEGAKGVFHIVKSGMDVPLSPDNDDIDYVVGTQKMRIFSGYGGEDPKLHFDSAKRLLIIAYCDGDVSKVETSFPDDISMEGNWHLYRIQVINNPGFSYGGKPLCA